MRPCNICNSPNRLELEKLYKEKNSIRYLERYCREHNYGFTYGMLYHHFRYHTEQDNSIIPTNLVHRLINNLEICERKISEMVNNDQMEPNILIRYISEIRHTIVELRSLLKEYNVRQTRPEDILHLILSLLHDIPQEYISRLQERYLKWKENPNLPPIYY